MMGWRPPFRREDLLRGGRVLFIGSVGNNKNPLDVLRSPIFEQMRGAFAHVPIHVAREMSLVGAPLLVVSKGLRADEERRAIDALGSANAIGVGDGRV